MKTFTLVGRILYSVIFIAAVPDHFKSGTVAYAAAQGVPLANLAVPASGVLALLVGTSIALGYRVRLGALGAIAFLVPVTIMIHNFWAVTDPQMHQLQLVMFMKNLGLIGGALTLVGYGAGAYSLDARAEARRAPRGAPSTALADGAGTVIEHHARVASSSSS